MTEKNKGKKAEKTKPNMEKEIIKRHPNWNRYILVLSLIWTVTIFILMGWNLTQINLYTLETARIQARSTYEKDIIYRSWNASHGGVYVPVTEKTQPNLYLVDIEEREIITPSGRLLTLIQFALKMLPMIGKRKLSRLSSLAKPSSVQLRNLMEKYLCA